jgi:hypothetical protein
MFGYVEQKPIGPIAKTFDFRDQIWENDTSESIRNLHEFNLFNINYKE